jgi:hypothetical protein
VAGAGTLLVALALVISVTLLLRRRPLPAVGSYAAMPRLPQYAPVPSESQAAA